MQTIRRIKLIVLAGILVINALLVLPSAQAAKSDIYRDILASKHFILVYDNVTPVSNVIKENETKVVNDVELRDYLKKYNAQRLIRDDAGEIICCIDGNRRYKEMNYGHISECQLRTADGKEYEFFRLDANDLSEYYGIVDKGAEGPDIEKGKVSPKPPKAYEHKHISFFTGPVMDKYLGPILPIKERRPNTPNYKLVATGTLEDGSSYEDYLYEDKGNQEMLRYCFQGDTLYTILGASLKKLPDGSSKYKKHILKVYKFSSDVREKLLNFPFGLSVKEANMKE